MRYKIYILFLILLFSCATQKQEEKKATLPFGNLQSVNTEKDEIAPTSRPKFYESDKRAHSPYYREIQDTDFNTDILSSSALATRELSLSLLDKKWRKYLTSNIESISFTSRNRGFITFSHSFDREFGERYNLRIDEKSGGTDIFEFILDPERGFEFKNIDNLKEVNTPFWDSHPFAADTIIDGEKITLLVWSTDRNKPYSKAIKIDGTILELGNLDLFYAFRVGDNWGEAKPIDFVNTQANEISPFIYCLCDVNSVLFFSSNRDKKTKDFDIFYQKINIDYKKQIISPANDTLKTFDKLIDNQHAIVNGDTIEINNKQIDNYINTYSDEKFPYIPYPYQDDLKLYFSSSRYQEKTKIDEDTYIKSNGGFDIYEFPIRDKDDFSCIPRQNDIFYELVILNSIDSSDNIISPLFKLEGGEYEVTDSTKLNIRKYKLKANQNYSAFGGSNYSDDAYDCYSTNKGVLRAYVEPKTIIKDSELISKSDTEIEILKYDDDKPELNSPEFSSESQIENIDGVKTQVNILKNIVVISIDEINKKYTRQITTSKTYNKIKNAHYETGVYYEDSNIDLLTDASVMSLKTLNSNLNTQNIKTSNRIIKDTVFISPIYKKAHNIKLNVFVLDKCTGQPIENSQISLLDDINDHGLFENNSKKPFIEIDLECGKTYKIYGGTKSSDNKNEFSQASFNYYLNPFDNSIVKGTTVSSEKTNTGGIDTRNITGNTILTDTVYMVRKTSPKYEIVLKNLKSKKSRIANPVIKVENTNTGQSISVDDDYFAFFAKENESYRVYGGSYLQNPACIDESAYIVQSYYKPNFVNGKYQFASINASNKNDFELVYGAIVESQLSYTQAYSFQSEGNICDINNIKDTVYLLPDEYPKPPCKIEFVEFEGYNRNVPYFQTGFWEVNTENNYYNHIQRLEDGFEITDSKVIRNRSEWDVVGEGRLFEKKYDDSSEYTIANGRWIELHPNNYYWGWRPDLYMGATAQRIEKRNERKKEYKIYAQQVDANLKLMTDKIKNDIFPTFLAIDSLTGYSSNIKMLVEIIALSDARQVERGWYIGDTTISYVSAKYDEKNQTIISDNISIEPPIADYENKIIRKKVDLGRNNRVLSDLRAWFGYQEFMNVLKDDPILQKYISQGLVISPGKSTDYSQTENSKIIIMTSGQDIDKYSKATIQRYDKEAKSKSYFNFDTTRRVEIVITIVNYENGRIIKSDCCNPNLRYDRVTAIKEED